MCAGKMCDATVLLCVCFMSFIDNEISVILRCVCLCMRMCQGRRAEPSAESKKLFQRVY